MQNKTSVTLKMTLLISMLCLCPFKNLIAQELYVGIAPLGLLERDRFSAELKTKGRVTPGAVFTHYRTGRWLGNKFEINGKFYLAADKNGETAEGIYLIAQGGIGKFKTPYEFSTSEPNFWGLPKWPTTKTIPGQKSTASGFGIGFGYQKTIQRVFLESNFRYQTWNVEQKPTIIKTENGETLTYKPYKDMRGIGEPGFDYTATVVLGFVFK